MSPSTQLKTFEKADTCLAAVRLTQTTDPRGESLGGRGVLGPAVSRREQKREAAAARAEERRNRRPDKGSRWKRELAPSGCQIRFSGSAQCPNAARHVVEHGLIVCDEHFAIAQNARPEGRRPRPATTIGSRLTPPGRRGERKQPEGSRDAVPVTKNSGRMFTQRAASGTARQAKASPPTPPSRVRTNPGRVEPAIKPRG